MSAPAFEGGLSPTAPVLDVLLLDPSLFTAPYDAALTEGLLRNGVEPIWAVRPTRLGDREELPKDRTDPWFYRRSERMPPGGVARSAFKGLEHLWGLTELVRRVESSTPDVVHFQWTVLPPFDALAMLRIRRRCPVVLTVHDTVPFNGEYLSLLQNGVADLPLQLCDRIIVHTQSGHQRLSARGIPPHKISVIPHGPLELRAVPRRAESKSARWTGVLFGELKHYKGVDLLVEAIAMIPEELRTKARFVVAGRPRMDIAPLRRRVAELGLSQIVDIHPRRFSDQEMADLFQSADGFIFPYRQIDASGVYYLVKSLGKWLIASRVGVFAEELRAGVQGELCDPGDVAGLSRAIQRAIVERPVPAKAPAEAEWVAIGAATRRVYEQAIASSL